MEWPPELLDLAVRALEICSVTLLAYGAYLAVRHTLREVVMRIGRHRLIPSAPSRRWTWKRGITAGIAALALVSLGAVLGATFARQPSHEQVTQREIPAPAPALETFYVPSQHVNQATRTEEQPDAF
jgi:disulfide bond formation protein DsbB